jgi:hypothetical protein
MTSNPAILGEVASALTAKFSSQRCELESFDSGAEMLRIYHADRYFVIAFDGHNYWVDEPKEQDGFTSSFRFRFPDLGSARDALLRMMSAQPVSQIRSAG